MYNAKWMTIVPHCSEAQRICNTPTFMKFLAGYWQDHDLLLQLQCCQALLGMHLVRQACSGATLLDTTHCTQPLVSDKEKWAAQLFLCLFHWFLLMH